MAYEIKAAAHFNTDSHVLKVQVFITSQCDNYFHPDVMLDGSVQLFNVYNLIETGLEEVPLERLTFDSTYANNDDYFTLYFINPVITTNLEARVTVNIKDQGSMTTVTNVLLESGTFSDNANTSVVGNAINRSWHLDPEPQRDYPDIREHPHSKPDLGENQTVIPDAEVVQTIYDDLLFEKFAEVKSAAELNGSLVYLGGGNRLLPQPGALIKQSIDTPPWELGASTFAEQAAAQLLENNTYTQLTGNLPQGYTMDSAGINIVDSTFQRLQGTDFVSRVWSLQINGASPASVTPFSVASLRMENPLSFDTTKPLALSLLVGLEKRASESSIDSVKLNLHFFDFANRALPSKSININPDDLFNARPIKPVSIQAHVSEYPPTTEKFTWSLDISSVNQGDYIVVQTALPSVTQTPFATSTILSGEARTADNLSYVPETPFPISSGAFVSQLAVGFEGAPTEMKYIFDTRDMSQQNGIAFRVIATGELELVVDKGGVTTLLTTAVPIAWESGKVFELLAEWNTTLLRITVDGTIVAENTSATMPSNFDTLTINTVQLGSDTLIQNHIDSEFIRSALLKRPRA